MRLLVDTQVFLWWRTNSPRREEEARQAIARAEVVLLSAASAWEIAIRVGLGKLRIPGPLEEAVEASGFGKLSIDFRHSVAVSTLPPHHSDPVDRMLIAQAQGDGLTVVTHDRQFEPYRIPILWT
jgi:PIN domain nuclease of toxin-antitoxin system